MASGGTLPRDATRTETVTGVVVVAHGGQSSSTEPTNALQPAVLRMIPVAAAVRHALRGSGAVVLRPRFRVRGWNGDQASPAADLHEMLDGIAADFGPVPIVLIGHSMGARAAIRAAGHPAVSAVAGLAPWLPLGEPADQLAGRRVLLAHGTVDTITSPAETWAFVERARQVTTVTAIEVRDGDHPMLRRARLWHAIAAEFARSAIAPSADSAPSASAGDIAAAATATAGDQARILLWPGAGPGLPVRTAQLAASGGTARRMLAFLRAQRSPYQPGYAGTAGSVVTVEFAAPAPLGLLGNQ